MSGHWRSRWLAGWVGAALLVGCGGGGTPQGHPDLGGNTDVQPGDSQPPGGDDELPPPDDEVPPDEVPDDEGPDDEAPPDEEPPPDNTPDAGTPDAGTQTPPVDAGTQTPPVDAGTQTPPVDAGTQTPPVDAGTPDAGTDPGPIVFPDVEGWRFYGPQHNAPSDVRGVTQDDDGNVWVAGGEEGLFVLKKGASTFQRFTLADGLRPYGYLPGGGAPEGDKYLNVLSVTGGKGSTVYVGYKGIGDCESNYYADKGIKNPNVYKSGDADKVTLQADGTLDVVHYDISSGPGVVGEEAGGREKVCTIHRIAYDRAHDFLWFGGNHAFALGDPDHAGTPASCGGKRTCSGVMEHTHPHVEAMSEDGLHVYRLTDAYHGLAVRPDGDVWVGGANRTTRFKFMSISTTLPLDSARFELARKASETGGTAAKANRLDIWPDDTNPDLPGGRPAKPSERKDDNVSGMALMADHTLWVSSFDRGLTQVTETGTVLQRRFETGGERFISSITRDPSDESLWVGFRWGDGLSRLLPDGTTLRYGPGLGRRLERLPVNDLQAVGSGSSRRVLVGFGRHEDGSPGAIGIYEGP